MKCLIGICVVICAISAAIDLNQKLFDASKSGDLDAVKSALENGADIEARDNNTLDAKWAALDSEILENDSEDHDYLGWTALHHSSENGHLEITKYLLEKGADIEAIDGNGETALHHASLFGHSDVVQYLIKKEANIKAKNRRGLTALHYSSLSGKLDVTKCLLDNGAEIEAKDDQGRTPLHHSSEHGHSKVTKYLVENGANIEAKDRSRETTLHRAATQNCKQGQLKVIKYLIEKGANIKATNNDGKTAENIALRYGKTTECVEMLRNANEENDLNKKLFEASRDGDLIVVQSAVKKGADIKSLDDEGQTAQDVASENGHMDIAEMLRNAADLNDELLDASRYGELEDVIKAIEEGADIRARDNAGWTALHRSSYVGHLEIVKHLTEKGADVNSRSNTGKTALYLSASQGNYDVVKYFIEIGADTEIKDDEGRSAQDIAEMLSRTKIAEILKIAVSSSTTATLPTYGLVTSLIAIYSICLRLC